MCNENVPDAVPPLVFLPPSTLSFQSRQRLPTPSSSQAHSPFLPSPYSYPFHLTSYPPIFFLSANHFLSQRSLASYTNPCLPFLIIPSLSIFLFLPVYLYLSIFDASLYNTAILFLSLPPSPIPLSLNSTSSSIHSSLEFPFLCSIPSFPGPSSS